MGFSPWNRISKRIKSAVGTADFFRKTGNTVPGGSFDRAQSSVGAADLVTMGFSPWNRISKRIKSAVGTADILPRQGLNHQENPPKNPPSHIG
ncbi:hypothetical protein [Cyclobacterium plantarum]|uniref:Uncharacterized protein n=1 Tax=Cyclobacterium plantarum TaxID=2716263 RepID=A0ABX0HDV3_9BACT|nr:hypothetical protein [Cyclobacterium plantarum]NHE59500.1 hypothetical protein [Cyclobacterium plantarum]